MENPNNLSTQDKNIAIVEGQSFMSFERFVNSGLAYSNIITLKIGDQLKRIRIDPNSIHSIQKYYQLFKEINLIGDKHYEMSTFFPEISGLIKRYGFQQYAK